MEEDVSQAADSFVPAGPPFESSLLPTSAPIEWYQPPRLGIIHLLAWITVAALMMKFNLAIEKYQPGPTLPELFQLIAKLIHAGNEIVSAAILAGGAVFWIDRSRGKPGKIQPGHWIVAINSLGIPCYLLLQSLIPWLGEGVLFSCYAILSLFIASAFFWGALRLPRPSRWKWALGFSGAEHLGYALSSSTLILISSYPNFRDILAQVGLARFSHQMDTLLYCLTAAIAVFLVLVNVVDLCKGIRRDWLHWLGAVTTIAFALTGIAWIVAYKLLV
jgi:hypothetical protein